MWGDGFRSVIGLGLMIASGLLVAAPAAADTGVEDPADKVCVGVDGPASCQLVAVSATERAYCWAAPCVAASGTGQAQACRGDTYAVACGAAVSGTEEATCHALNGACATASGTGHAGTALVSVSGTGDSGSSIVAVSGTGSARASILAVSVTGSADAGEVAVSGTNCSEAELEVDSCDAVVVQPASDAEGQTVVVSGTGDAECRPGVCVAVAPDGNATGCVAVSGTGDAETDCSADGPTLAVSGCGTLQDQAGEQTGCGDLSERLGP